MRRCELLAPASAAVSRRTRDVRPSKRRPSAQQAHIDGASAHAARGRLHPPYPLGGRQGTWRRRSLFPRAWRNFDSQASTLCGRIVFVVVCMSYGPARTRTDRRPHWSWPWPTIPKVAAAKGTMFEKWVRKRSDTPAATNEVGGRTDSRELRELAHFAAGSVMAWLSSPAGRS